MLGMGWRGAFHQGSGQVSLCKSAYAQDNMTSDIGCGTEV